MTVHSASSGDFSREYEAATVIPIEEAKPIIAAGFEYVTEKKGIMLFFSINMGLE